MGSRSVRAGSLVFATMEGGPIMRTLQSAAAGALVLFAFACLPIPSQAAETASPGDSGPRFLLGADMGLSFYHPKGGGNNVTVVAFPSNVAEYLPSIRVGATAGASQEHELYAKAGFVSESSGGHTFHVVVLTGNYQLAFSPGSAASPYLTAGGGLVSGGGGGSTSTSGLVGGGAGVRFRVAEGHGALRLEGRFDHVSESDGISQFGVGSFLFGFELWM
jgi:hypothetical protein